MPTTMPQARLPVYAFDVNTYTNFNQTTDTDSRAAFTLPLGNYHFRADLNGAQFWGGNSKVGDWRVIGNVYESRYTLGMEFEWDPKKAAGNLRKHGVSFAEAATVTADRLSVNFPDPDHSLAEDRYITGGTSAQQRLIMVAHTDRGGRIRIISARELTRAEREVYEEEILD